VSTSFYLKPFRPPGFVTVRVQSILYNLGLDQIRRSLEYLDNAALNAKRTGAIGTVMIAYGDCSPQSTIDDETLRLLRQSYTNIRAIEYTYFGTNLGSAAGHNRLLNDAASDLVMILNPDVLASPNLFGELVDALARPDVGLVEARQIPIEHPKDYDRETGETSWASTACAMGPMKVFKDLGGFDSDTFFLYGDDVDFSWRARLAGYKVVHQYSAVVFHDKRLTPNGGWIPSEAERYYSAEAALLLAYKYCRADVTVQYLDFFRKSADETLLRAAGAFELRRKTGLMPSQIDEHHSVGQFVSGAYARHRFLSR
jgi:GT2 family glycosyltransferase